MNEQNALAEMAKHIKQNCAAGVQHHETVKTKAVTDDGLELSQIIMGIVAFAIAVFIALAVFGAKFAPLMR